MQGADSLFSGLSAIAFVVLLVLAVLTLLMPVMVYAAQKWAYRSYRELSMANRSLAKLLEEMKLQRQALLQAVTAEKHERGSDGTNA